MFSFHKPKIYRSLMGCCICRAKSSSSRFTDSKKYEAEFEKCFRIVEKRCGEICNACVLLVKRWKKLPTGTNRNWHHVVDARAGPGTKSFKNRTNLTGGGNGGDGPDRNERDLDKKRSYGKSSNVNGLRKNSKATIQLMTSSDSESEEEIEDDLMICDDLMDSMEHRNDIDSLHSHLIDGRESVNGNHNESQSKSSLRRSTRLAKSGLDDGPLGCNGNSLDLLDSLSNDNSNITTLNGVGPNSKTLMRKRKSAAERFFSFLDTTVWQKEKVCCGVIFKGPNNTILIYPELLNPCSCRQPQLASSTPSTPTSTISSSNLLSSTIQTSPGNLNIATKSVAKTAFISTAVSLPPKLLSPNSVKLSCNNNKPSMITTMTTPSSVNNNNYNSNKTKPGFMTPPKTLRHQDSFPNHSSLSISSDSTLSDGHCQDTDDPSSGVSSMVVLTGDDSTPDSDRLSTVSSTGLMDADDASSCSDAGSYETLSSLNHHEMVDMVVVSNSGKKTPSDSVPSLSYSAQAVV